MDNTPTKADILKAAQIERMIAVSVSLHNSSSSYTLLEIAVSCELRADALERIAEDMPDD